MKSPKNTNGQAKTSRSERSPTTLHVRLPQTTFRLIQKQAKEMKRTMHAQACLLLEKSAEIYERVGDRFRTQQP